MYMITIERITTLDDVRLGEAREVGIVTERHTSTLCEPTTYDMLNTWIGLMVLAGYGYNGVMDAINEKGEHNEI